MDVLVHYDERMEAVTNLLKRTDILLATIAVMTVARWTLSGRDRVKCEEGGSEKDGGKKDEEPKVAATTEIKEATEKSRRIIELEEEVKRLKTQISQQTSFNTDVNRSSSLNVRYYPTPLPTRDNDKGESKVLFRTQSASERKEKERDSPSSVCDTPDSSSMVTPVIDTSSNGRPTYTPASRIMTAGRENCIQVMKKDVLYIISIINVSIVCLLHFCLLFNHFFAYRLPKTLLQRSCRSIDRKRPRLHFHLPLHQPICQNGMQIHLY